MWTKDSEEKAVRGAGSSILSIFKTSKKTSKGKPIILMAYLAWVAIAIIVLVTLLSGCGNLAFADEINDLVPCIIEVESHGNPNAVSPAGAIGLMQITPIVVEEYNESPQSETMSAGILVQGFDRIYARKIHKEELFEPDTNRTIGTWYLRRLKDHYLKDEYTIERMLAAYNGGITRLRKNGYDVSKMPKETRDYVKKVMKLYRRGE